MDNTKSIKHALVSGGLAYGAAKLLKAPGSAGGITGAGAKYIALSQALVSYYSNTLLNMVIQYFPSLAGFAYIEPAVVGGSVVLLLKVVTGSEVLGANMDTLKLFVASAGAEMGVPFIMEYAAGAGM